MVLLILKRELPIFKKALLFTVVTNKEICFIELFSYCVTDIAQCFFVIFIIKPEFENLNFYEAKWYRILNAKININKMILPRI